MSRAARQKGVKDVALTDETEVVASYDSRNCHFNAAIAQVKVPRKKNLMFIRASQYGFS